MSQKQKTDRTILGSIELFYIKNTSQLLVKGDGRSAQGKLSKTTARIEISTLNLSLRVAVS